MEQNSTPAPAVRGRIPTPPAPIPVVGLSWLEKLGWAVLGLGCQCVVALSLWLRPDARLFGTHEQLGLPPCMFTEASGIPCPGCGLTTSFANMAHLHVINAFRGHLMGPLLFLGTLALAVYAPYAIVKQRPLSILLDGKGMVPALMATASAGVLTFILRVLHILPAP